MTVKQYLLDRISEGTLHVALLDPDKQPAAQAGELAKRMKEAGTDAVFIGGSTGVTSQNLSDTAKAIKEMSGLPTIHFPGNAEALSADVDATKYPVPEYLYDKNPFNNIRYVLNKDVLLNYILKPLVDPTERTDWSQLYKPWWTDQYYTKANVLMYYEPAPEAQEQMPEDLFLSGAAANLDINICPYIEAHPETEFVFFYPPYSILYWNDITRQKQLEAEIAELEYVTERLLSYENVRMFCFQDQEEIICDLNNYADYTHYHGDVCRYIVECFADGACELTLDNYREVFSGLSRLASTYDYEAIYDNWYE